MKIQCVTLIATVFAFFISFDVRSAGLSDSTLPGNPVAISVVPAGYNPEKHILLVAEMHRRRNKNKRHKLATKALDKSMGANFPYKYEIVSPKDMDTNSKYSDTSVYKYALMNELKMVSYDRPSRVVHGRLESSAPMVRTFIDFHFYDRISKNNFPATGHSSTIIDRVIKPLSDLVRAEVYKQQ